MCNPLLIPAGIAIAGGVGAAAIGAKYLTKKLTPDIPKLPDAPDGPPKSVDPIVQSARSRERDRARASSSRSTILTGSAGLNTSATTAPKTLLGS